MVMEDEEKLTAVGEGEGSGVKTGCCSIRLSVFRNLHCHAGGGRTV